MGFTASQIRQDFNCFGGFGQQGYGYPVSQLKQEISDILGFNNQNYFSMTFKRETGLSPMNYKKQM